jgi:Xaa-Pro aminopeptidase
MLMTVTVAEMEMRQSAIRQFVEMDHLEALLLIGDTSINYGFCGDLRYYTNNRVIFYRQAVVVFPQSEPVMFVESATQRHVAAQRSLVKDCRISQQFLADISRILKERGISTGKIGVNLEMLPAAWYISLKRELPQVEWVDVHERIMQIRFNRSRGEADIYRKGAALGDGSFEAALRVIGPGVSDFEIAAEIEHYSRARGAEEHFTLIGSGKFASEENKRLFFAPPPPSSKQVEAGDSISMEISPRYEGYWTQLVRTVTLGHPSEDLKKIHKVCCDAIKKGLEKFSPGKTVKDVVLAMESCVTDCGYILKPPMGHICGVDMIEGRVSRQNEMVLEPGTAVIIHPTVYTPDGKTNFFWGETYLVTRDGYERLHHTSDELLAL